MKKQATIPKVAARNSGQRLCSSRTRLVDGDTAVVVETELGGELLLKGPAAMHTGGDKIVDLLCPAFDTVVRYLRHRGLLGNQLLQPFCVRLPSTGVLHHEPPAGRVGERFRGHRQPGAVSR